MEASEQRQRAEQLLQELQRKRDELRVKIHLAGAEAREEWEKAEKKWERLRSRLAVVGEAAEETGDDVGEALEQLGEELRKGYRRIRDLL